MLQHLLGDGEVSDHAVAQRPYGADIAGRAAQHFLGFLAHGLDALAATGLGADGHHRRLIQDDALVADENQGIGGAQIYGQVIDQQTAESI